MNIFASFCVFISLVFTISTEQTHNRQGKGIEMEEIADDGASYRRRRRPLPVDTRPSIAEYDIERIYEEMLAEYREIEAREAQSLIVSRSIPTRTTRTASGTLSNHRLSIPSVFTVQEESINNNNAVSIPTLNFGNPTTPMTDFANSSPRFTKSYVSDSPRRKITPSSSPRLIDSSVTSPRYYAMPNDSVKDSPLRAISGTISKLSQIYDNKK